MLNRDSDKKFLDRLEKYGDSEKTIIIPLEEYKDLLELKGRYLQIKEETKPE